ncbi:MAG: GNAT family N-acetyltransferase [Thermomicrobium sp.]|nr:GNAT family N-acetyltransferase [Thermomicrobium sp.]
MHRQLPDGTLVRHIRRQVFPSDWLEPTYWPERFYRELRRSRPEADPDRLWVEAEERALAECDTRAARIARVVVHPDYRGEGLGHTLVEVALRWIAERRIPEMRRSKVLVETVAMMARYNPFFERRIPLPLGHCLGTSSAVPRPDRGSGSGDRPLPRDRSGRAGARRSLVSPSLALARVLGRAAPLAPCPQSLSTHARSGSARSRAARHPADLRCRAAGRRNGRPASAGPRHRAWDHRRADRRFRRGEDDAPPPRLGSCERATRFPLPSRRRDHRAAREHRRCHAPPQRARAEVGPRAAPPAYRGDGRRWPSPRWNSSMPSDSATPCSGAPPHRNRRRDSASGLGSRCSSPSDRTSSSSTSSPRTSIRRSPVASPARWPRSCAGSGSPPSSPPTARKSSAPSSPTVCSSSATGGVVQLEEIH